jgi:hypothetical protein
MATIGIVAAAGATASGRALVPLVLFCSVLAYFFAVMTRRTIGTTPWRIPPIVWALLSVVLLPPFGLIIEVLARFTTRRHPASTVARQPEPLIAAQHMTTAYPANPAGGSEPWPAMAPSRPGPGGWRPAPAGAPWTSTPPLFGWYEDPAALHEERYWDGRQWSDHVRDAGVVSSDPLPPYTAGADATTDESTGDPAGV